MFSKYPILLFLATGVLAIGLVNQALCRPVVHLFDEGHVDLNVDLAEGGSALELNLIFDELYAGAYQLGQSVLLANDLSKIVLDIDDVEFWPWLGDVGGEVYNLPTNQVAGMLYLGIASYNTSPLDFVNGKISLNLTNIDGPGVFFLQRGFNDPVIDSSDPSATEEIILAGGHEHMNWWFTEPGMYKLYFQASAERTGGAGPVQSEVTAVNFLIDPQPHIVWAVQNFGFDPVFSGFDFTAIRQNGRAALIDYAFDLDPYADGLHGLPSATTVVEDGQVYPAIIYRVPSGRSDLSYSIEGSTNLQDWNPLFEGADYTVSPVAVDSDGTPRMQVVLNQSASLSRYFLRVRVDLLP